MKFERMPILRIEVERMEQTIMAQLGVHGSELGEAISAQIDKAIASYPFEEKVKIIVHTQVTKSIESYFAFGQGGRAIRDSIDSMFSSLSNKSEREQDALIKESEKSTEEKDGS